MTAPRRPTWSDFLRWVATERIAYCPGPVYGLKEAATFARTRREAFAAMLGCGMRPEFVGELAEEWLAMRAEPADLAGSDVVGDGR